MPTTLTQRWTVTHATPLGDVRTRWELAPEGLHLRSDAPTGADAQPLRWDAIAEAATAVVDLPAHKGGPDMVSWMPGRMEWLLVSRSDGGRSFMHALPASDVRDAIVAGMRERLGSRWVGEQLPLQSAQKRFRISTRGDGLKVAAIIGSALLLLVLLLMSIVIVGSVLYLPALFALGAWLFRKGLVGLRDALQAAGTPTARVSSAPMGLVELEGRALPGSPATIRCRRAAIRCSTAPHSRGTAAAGCACASAGWKPAGRSTSSARSTKRATCPPPARSAGSRG